MDLSKDEQKTSEYLKIHPLGRVPALILEDGSPLTENTAILPFLASVAACANRTPVEEARALSRSASTRRASIRACAYRRPERYTDDKSRFLPACKPGQGNVP